MIENQAQNEGRETAQVIDLVLKKLRDGGQSRDLYENLVKTNKVQDDDES